MSDQAHLDHDWYSRPLPANVSIGQRCWCYSAFAFLHHQSRRPGAVRVGDNTGIYNGTFFDLGPDAEVMIAYGPVGESSSASPTFAWGAESGASTYRLTVTTAEGTTVWSVSAADTMVALSDSVQLRQGERYLWVVDALLDDGTTRSTGLREFRVGP